MVKRLCDERTCVLNADFTLSVQSEDPFTMFTALRSLMQAKPGVTAHLYSAEGFWGAWMAMDDAGDSKPVEAWLPSVPEKTRHWIRLLVEDERKHRIVLDRTYHPNGDVTEPMQSW